MSENMIIEINIEKQIGSRTDQNKVVADSQNYLKVHFTFTDEWTGTKTALFKHKHQKQSYAAILDETDSCIVPHEVIKSGCFYISAICGDLITANNVLIEVDDSGYNAGATLSDPTPSVYNQILTAAENAEKIAQSVRNDADAGKFNGSAGLIIGGENITAETDKDGKTTISFENNGTYATTADTYTKQQTKDLIPDISDLAKKSEIPDVSHFAKKEDLKAVATTGSYNDLSDKPTIPDTSGLATKTEVNAKQNALTTAQLNAVNSGITTAKVSTYDGYASTIASKADTVDLETKANRETVAELTAATTIAHNTIYRAGVLASLTISLPATFEDDFISKFDFTSGATATAFTAPDTLKWDGSDIVSNALVPGANKRYSIFIYYDGVFLNAIARGVDL